MFSSGDLISGKGLQRIPNKCVQRIFIWWIYIGGFLGIAYRRILNNYVPACVYLMHTGAFQIYAPWCMQQIPSFLSPTRVNWVGRVITFGTRFWWTFHNERTACGMHSLPTGLPSSSTCHQLAYDIIVSLMPTSISEEQTISFDNRV